MEGKSRASVVRSGKWLEVRRRVVRMESVGDYCSG